MKTYREIKVWQKAVRFVTKVYELTASFPDEEKYGIINQIRRSAVSIPSNIAEGFGRYSAEDFKRFLRISMGSLFELQTQLEISRNLNYLSNDNFKRLYDDSREIEIMLFSFIQSITIDKNAK